MALLRTSEIREMTAEERSKTLAELRGELMHERGTACHGWRSRQPRKNQGLRTNIARIQTIQKEEEKN